MPDRWEFSNDCFRKGEKRLLCDIQRRKISPAVTHTQRSNSGEEEQVVSSNSSRETKTVFGKTDEELVSENQRLRRENAELNKELNKMKNLCNSIYVMMSNYAQVNSGKQQLDLLPLKRLSENEGREDEDVSPRLFGVPIGVKRVRDESDGSDVKFERLDGGGSVDSK